MYAGVNGYFDDIPVERVAAAEAAFHRFVQGSYPDLLQAIASETRDRRVQADGGVLGLDTQFAIVTLTPNPLPSRERERNAPLSLGTIHVRSKSLPPG